MIDLEGLLETLRLLQFPGKRGGRIASDADPMLADSSGPLFRRIRGLCRFLNEDKRRDMCTDPTSGKVKDRQSHSESGAKKGKPKCAGEYGGRAAGRNRYQGDDRETAAKSERSRDDGPHHPRSLGPFRHPTYPRLRGMRGCLPVPRSRVGPSSRESCSPDPFRSESSKRICRPVA